MAKSPLHLKIIGRNVARLRHIAGLTQAKLAEKAGITDKYLQMIEAGQRNASIAVLIRLKKALKCSWESIFDTL